jgi:protease-4
MDFKGLSAELMFLKIYRKNRKMEVIRHGKYKSAVEPFLENEMSDANREQVTVLLNSLSVTADISKSRNISVDKLNEIANGLLEHQKWQNRKLVDIIAYEDVYHNAIKKKSRKRGRL